jgi:hypothetical protein
VAVGDFNGDGRPDLAVAASKSTFVTVLLNATPVGDATPSFSGQQALQVGNTPYAVAVGDFNGDGRSDIAVINGGDKTVSVLMNTTPAGVSNPSFTAQQTFAVGSGPDAVAVADFNGDGRPDLVVVNGSSSGTVSVLLNTAAAGASDPSFTAQQTFAVGSLPDAVAVADFNGDGRPDVAVANYTVNANVSLSVLENTTAALSAVASFAAQQTFYAGSNPAALAVAELGIDGRPDLVAASYTSGMLTELSGLTKPVPSTVPVVVATFGNQGVKEYNRATFSWVQLTPSSATLLAADAQGDIVGEFPGYGLQLYRPAAGWVQINGVDATALAMDPQGDVVAQFPGYGVGEYLPAAGWHTSTQANAALLAMDSHGDIVGDFPGHGVYLYQPATGWGTQPLNGVDATALAMDPQGDVVASFHGYGVGEYRPTTGWKTLRTLEAQALAMDALGDVTADLVGGGVSVYHPSSNWQVLSFANTALVQMGANGDVFAAFAGYGVQEYDPYRGWYSLYGPDPSALVVA